jgi:peptidoglycan/xylan/chitin deacetylase (PgdA/CDA1 family)
MAWHSTIPRKEIFSSAPPGKERYGCMTFWTDMEPGRDLVGYGTNPPDPRWPGDAHIAVNFNLNVEGGGELTPFNGDTASEGMLNDIGVPSKQGVRVPLVESVFEYGSRRGAWRILEVDFSVKLSVLGVVRALEQNPGLTQAFVVAVHEIVSHGYRWIDYCEVGEEVEREHIRRAVAGIVALTGERPLGWMTGRPGPNTRRLLAGSVCTIG